MWTLQPYNVPFNSLRHSHPFKKKLAQIDEYLTQELVLERPKLYLSEIKQELSDQMGSDIFVSTICNFLKTDLPIKN